MENTSVGIRPVQILSWKEKLKEEKKWFKENVDYYIARAGMNGEGKKQDMQMLYGAYNNQFPLEWFSHITDPLSAKKSQHKSFPAKIRPVNILRTNLDLLMAEYPRRPFIFQVNNLGDDGYSSYMEELNSAILSNVQNYFKLSLQQQMMMQGMIDQNGQPVNEEAVAQVQEQMDNIKYPEEISEQFQGSYRDKIAIQGQKWLTRCIREHNIRAKLLKMFKDWLVVGRVYSYKGVEFDNVVYERISPLMIEFDKSPEVDYIEDGEWVVAKRLLTISDVVDRFYDELKESDHKKLQTTNIYNTPTTFANYLTDTGTKDSGGKVIVWHVQWKGLKKLGILTRINPESGMPETLEVDESYKADKSMGETIEWLRPNEVYEGWRIGPDMYVKLGPLDIQRNAMNNFSTCKLSYNGRSYSDTHSENISVMEIGMPFQIMYIIVTRTLELTIAKSKGKILLIDQNAIPDDGDWDEEKFFYYAEALGYGLLNRNQIGVDKSWNQYQVLDMSLFDSISQLIELQGYFKQQWDDIIGINRQRKGQTYASDLQGVNERAVFQSTVITDMIFNLYEEFVEKELQGLLDLSRFTNANGVRKQWYDTELGNQILEVTPENYCNAELGIAVESSSEAIAMKNKIEANVQAMLQNGVKPSTMFEVIQTQNLSELKQKLLRIEEIQAEMEQGAAASEQEANEAADNRKKAFMEYEKMLDTAYMNEEYDRKEDIEIIRGDYSTFTYQDGDSNDNGEPDALEISKFKLAREKLTQEKDEKNNARQERKEKQAQDIAMKDRQLKQQDKQATAKNKIAAKKTSQRK